MGTTSGKFKEGDWVRLTECNKRNNGPALGDVGRVTQDSRVPYVDWLDFGDKYAVIASSELELWTPAAGDRVRVTGNPVWAGVGKVYDAGGPWVCVTMLNGPHEGKRGGFLPCEIEPVVGEPAVGEPSTAKFKAGDRVRIVKGAGQFIYGTKIGDIGVVIGDYSGVGFVDIELTDEDGDPVHQIAEAYQIELVAANDNPAQPEIGTAIVCVFKDGKPAPADTPKVHDDVDSARAEALRLGGIRKGETYGVYKLVATHVQAKPVYVHEWQRLAAGGERNEAQKELRRLTGMSEFAAASFIGHFYHEQRAA